MAVNSRATIKLQTSDFERGAIASTRSNDARIASSLIKLCLRRLLHDIRRLRLRFYRRMAEQFQLAFQVCEQFPGLPKFAVHHFGREPRLLRVGGLATSRKVLQATNLLAGPGPDFTQLLHLHRSWRLGIKRHILSFRRSVTKRDHAVRNLRPLFENALKLGLRLFRRNLRVL